MYVAMSEAAAKLIVAMLTPLRRMSKPVSAVAATPALPWLAARSTASRVRSATGRLSSNSLAPGWPGLKTVTSAGGSAAFAVWTTSRAR